MLAAKPPSDTLLLIRSGKLDSATQKTKWLKALLAVGVFIQVWPLTAQQLPTWLAERLKKVNIHCTPAGLQLLADRVEGNLLAAQQEIEKLTLLHGAGSQLDEHDIEHAVIMSSRYDVFRLVDACLAGQSQQIVHIMHTLKAEGIEAILVLWALARECRLLARLAYQQQQGQALSTLLRQERVFESRHSMVKTALQRGNLPLFYSLLQQAKRIDDMIKGAQPGRVWDALLRLSLHLAGTRL